MSAGTRPPRVDGLPEGIQYRDNGCEVSPSCLACPLEICRYDNPNAAQQRQARDAQIVTLYSQERTAKQIALAVRTSPRTVRRVIRRVVKQHQEATR